MDSSLDPPSRPALDIQLLLEHGPWMRRLARTLVRDVERAEELSQETWRRLLENPPLLDRPFRGWIATVMRNLVRAERRGTPRRATRERAAAVVEALPSSHDVLERVELQRELVQAVLELDEPYRTTVCLRYFEERTPSEIAAQERVPVTTVKTRLARGIALLRERLGRSRGPDGTNLLAALIAWERTAPTVPVPPASFPPWSLLPLAMNAKLVVSLVVLVAAGIVYLCAVREESPARARTRELAQPEAREELAPISPLAPAASPATTRESAVAATSPAPTSAPAATEPAPLVRGSVLDVEGAPVSGIEIRLSPRDSGGAIDLATEAGSAPVVATSGPDGAFEVAGRHQGRLFVRDPRWTTLLTGVPVDGRSGHECLIVVAPAVELAGVVIDEYGAPLAEALVKLEPPSDLRGRLARVLDFSAAVSWRVTSDEAGRFRFPSAPAISRSVLRAELADYEAREEPAPLASRADLVLVLARTAESPSLRGVVVDAGGSPVEDALVARGLDTVRTDEDGRFAFRLDDPRSVNATIVGWMKAPEDTLRAVKRGYLPAELRAQERDAAGQPLWPRPLVLHLGTESLTIGGRVVDERGEPLEDVRVWIADPALFGVERSRDDADFVMTENLLAGGDPDWNWVETDGDGAFELAGLTQRDYAVAAMDTETLLRVVETPVRAGRHDLEIVLRNAALFPRLAGRVVDGFGRAVPGVSVFAQCDALEMKNSSGTVFRTHHEMADATETDGEGRFELERVPKDLAYLRLQSSDTIPLEWGRGDEGGLAALIGDDAQDVVIAVERRCHFQVELAVPAEADEIGVLDAQGEELVISEFLGNGRRDTDRHPIVEGRTSTLAVGDRAATLVLYRAGSEVRRVPLRLTPDEPTILRL